LGVPRSCLALYKTRGEGALEKVVETDKSNVVANRDSNIFLREKNFEKDLPLGNLLSCQPDGETPT
jgi:hypothetical protein